MHYYEARLIYYMCSWLDVQVVVVVEVCYCGGSYVVWYWCAVVVVMEVVIRVCGCGSDM